ncbi:DUF5677 domain-containing protein [uncultured Leifsonia sp.]|uniref:DUF5677 domain-containing protein n=1 Tax=uncultured Leifsonia sp. TaxID=340359 RepID=UPI0025F6F9A3|nr:DUF5677 domain-containing protein [uncultured Leifsonia sp.]
MTGGEQFEERQTIAESVEVASQLVELWRANPPEALTVLDRSASRALSTLAHVDHAANLADAISTLVTRNMLVQAVPLLRLTMECAVTAAWFAVTPNSGRAAGLEGAKERLKLARGLARLSGADASDVIEDLEQNVRDESEAYSAEAHKFEQRALSLAGMDWLYVGYRELSGYSHAGTPLMDHYLRPAERTADAPLGVTYSPENEFAVAEQVFQLHPLLMHLALTAWDTIAVEHPMRDSLREVAETLGVSPTIQRRISRREAAASRLAMRQGHSR